MDPCAARLCKPQHALRRCTLPNGNSCAEHLLDVAVPRCQVYRQAWRDTLTIQY